MYRRSLVCACAMYAHARASMCVCVDTLVYIYKQVTRVCQDIPYHMSGTFNKPSSLAIFDKLISYVISYVTSMNCLCLQH